MIATYDPSVFTGVRTMQEARACILTPEHASTDERWEVETPWIAGLIARRFALRPDSCVVDFGCGVGRLAKALIETTGCRVIGVDISLGMRSLAVAYVNDPRFSVMSPEEFDAAPPGADVVLAVWVLQHCPELAAELARLRSCLLPRGRLFVLNMANRSVPSLGGVWLDDGVDVRAELRRAFFPIAERRDLPADVFGRGSGAYWAVFARALGAR